MKFLKGLSAVAVSVVMMFSVTDVNVFAATTTQDGLEFSLTTDKEAYVRDENIFVTVKVTNNNSVSVENIAIENLVPDNYHISDDTVVHKMIPYLGAGETAELNTTFVYTQAENEESSKEELSKEESSKEESSKEESSKEESSKEESSKENNLVITNSDNNAVKTGDSGLNIFVIVLPILISAITIVICIKKRKGKKLLSLLLCTSVAGTMVVYGGHIKSSAVENNDDYSVILEEIASIDGSNLSISSTVKYDRIATVFSTQYDGMGNIDSSDPEIEIYDFRADTYDIPVGEEKKVTFTAEIFSDVVLADKSVSVVNKYGDLIGYMNDNGTDGDKEAGDGLYTLQLSLSSKKAYSAQYYGKVNDTVSKGFSIGYYLSFSDSDEKIADSIILNLSELVSPYVDEYGDVTEDNVDVAMFAVNKSLDEMQKQGLIKQFTMTKTSALILTNNYYSFSFNLHIKDTAVNVGDEVNIVTYQPFRGEDRDVFYILRNMSDKSTDGAAEEISNIFGFSFSGNYDNENVTLHLLENIGNNKIIIFDSHGGCSDIFGSGILTGEQSNYVANGMYAMDIGYPSYRICRSGAHSYNWLKPNGDDGIKHTYEVTGGFFDKYLDQHEADLKDAFIYLGACHTGDDMLPGTNINHQDYHLAQSFIDHGAGAVVVTNGEIQTIYNNKMRESILNYMTTMKDGLFNNFYTVQEAIDKAIEDNGNQTGCPFVVGDTDYSFSRLLSENYGTVSGQVVDSESGYGINGALVRIYKNDYLVSKIRTDSNGYYSDNMLRPGSYVIKITDSYYHSMKIAVTVDANETVYNRTALMFKVVNNPVQRAYGTINNAVNGMAVPGATVKVRQNWNNKIGEIITEVDTDENGKYDIELREGFYTLEVSKKDYITGYGSIVVGSLGMFSQDISISPVISDSTYRVVLTWNDNPSDLDSHLFGKVNGKYDYHIYYNEQSESDGEKIIANLDRDDTDGNGPETTVFETLPNGEYDYYIDWYSGLGTWSSSGGKIDIYSGNDLIKTLNVPNADHQNGSWKVFSVKNGVFTVYNTIQDEDIYVD